MNRLSDDPRFIERSVLQIALDVHMTAMGSYERFQEDQLADVAELQRRIEVWEDSLPRAAEFDAAVRKLMLLALLEDAQERRKQEAQ